MDAWVESLLDAPPALVCGALFLILILEGIGLPFIPFEPVFLAAGLMIEGGRLDLVSATLIGAAGNLVGNLIGYRIGLGAGNLLTARQRPILGVHPAHLEQVERWFARYGIATTFLARFVGLIRTPAILGAGMSRMDPWKFIFWSGLGGTLWCLLWLAGSAALGASLLNAIKRYGWWATASALAIMLAAMYYFHRRLTRIPR